MRNKLLVILIVGFLLLMAVAMFMVGYGFAQENAVALSPVEIKHSISFLEFCKHSHVYYAEHPELCNETSGSADWNWCIAAEYQDLIDLLRGTK